MVGFLLEKLSLYAPLWFMDMGIENMVYKLVRAIIKSYATTVLILTATMV